MKRVGFILKPEKREAGKLVQELVPTVGELGHTAVVLREDRIAPDNAVVVPEKELGGRVDIAVVLGGDGTMLRASALVADFGVPLLGVNLGRLGFLTAFHRDEARQALVAALEGTLRRSQRMRLRVTYYPRSGEPITRSAINDAVIHQGSMARLIEVEAHLDEHLITTYRADGLIIATPTGSTGYNLAAGGPILLPGQAAMALTPICAHALTHRPLVVPKEATIALALPRESRGVVLTIDGQWGQLLERGDRVEIRTNARPLLLFEPERGYFDILREKLHWGARSENKE